MKIKRQSGDLINFNNDSPESPRKFLMDFSSLEAQQIVFNVEKRRASYKNILYNTMKQAQMSFAS